MSLTIHIILLSILDFKDFILLVYNFLRFVQETLGKYHMENAAFRYSQKRHFPCSVFLTFPEAVQDLSN